MPAFDADGTAAARASVATLTGLLPVHEALSRARDGERGMKRGGEEWEEGQA